MARVKSQTVGKASGRVGNIYFRTVRGRTIQCDLPTVNSAVTRAPQSVARQNVFGLVNRFAKIMPPVFPNRLINEVRFTAQRLCKAKLLPFINGFIFSLIYAGCNG